MFVLLFMFLLANPEFMSYYAHENLVSGLL